MEMKESDMNEPQRFVYDTSYFRRQSTDRLMQQYKAACRKICSLDLYRRTIERELKRRVVSVQHEIFAK